MCPGAIVMGIAIQYTSRLHTARTPERQEFHFKNDPGHFHLHRTAAEVLLPFSLVDVTLAKEDSWMAVRMDWPQKRGLAAPMLFAD